jgi:hypothetical protein
MADSDICPRYRERIGALADHAVSNPRWENDLRGLVRSFESEAASLKYALAVRRELVELLEFAAVAAPTVEARAVLVAAIKQIELGG